MKKIEEFLAKFSRILTNGNKYREAVTRIIKAETGFDIPSASITKSKNILFINTHPAAKSEIFLHKEKILSSLYTEKILISDIL